MPRNGKKTRAEENKKSGYAHRGKSSGKARSSKRDADVQNWARDRIVAGKTLKEISYEPMAKRVMDMFKSRHTIYEDREVRSKFMDFRGGAAVSVPKAAEVRNTLLPSLAPTDHTRTVLSLVADPVMIAHAEVLGQYLSYTARECNFTKQGRKGVDDSLLRGRGFVRPCWDEVRGLVTSKYVSSLDVVIDPDVTDIDDAEWIAIRRREPLWRAKDAIKEKWRKENLKATSVDTADSDDDAADNDHERIAASNDILEYWEFYSKMGSGSKGADYQGDHRGDNFDYVKLCISLEAEFPMFEGEWDVPLYLDNDWPVASVDLLETLDQLWPESIMGQVNSSVVSIDLLSSLILGSAKQEGKTILLCDKDLAVEAKERIKNGTPVEFIEVKADQGGDIGKKLQFMDRQPLGAGLASERAWHELQVEKVTGVTDTLQGAGQNGGQDRSATASKLRGAATNVRLSDLRGRTEYWLRTVARHEAIMVRTELDWDEVAPYVDEAKLAMFYISIKGLDGAEIPVRDPRTDEERLDAEEDGDEDAPLSLESISPSASTFFSDVEEAVGAVHELLMAIQAKSRQDFETRELAVAMANQSGVPAEDPMRGHFELNAEAILMDPNGQEWAASLIKPVTVEVVWRETQSMTTEQMVREVTYDLGTGTMPEHDIESERERVNILLQQVMPIMLQNMDYDGANKILEMSYEVERTQEDKRVYLIPPPPPPAPAGEGGPPPGAQ